MIHASPLSGHFLAPNSSLLYPKQPPLHPRCPLGRLRSTEVGFCFFWISVISAHSHPTPDHPVHFTYARPPTRLRKPASAPFFPFSEANSSVLVHCKNRSRGGEGLGARTSPPRYCPVTRLGVHLAGGDARRRAESMILCGHRARRRLRRRACLEDATFCWRGSGRPRPLELRPSATADSTSNKPPRTATGGGKHHRRWS